MRGLFLSAVVLVGCDGPREFHQGEATRYLGEPLGGYYNPDLADCTLTMGIDDIHTQTLAWDERGRLVTQTTVGPDLEEPHVDVIAWDGPCIASMTWALADGGSHVEEFSCDDRGWWVDYAFLQVGPDGDVTPQIEYAFENTFAGGRLVERTGNDMTETFGWSGNRITSYSVAWGGEAPQPESEIRYNRAGWIESVEVDGAETISYAYDGPDRLIAATSEDSAHSWVYPDDEARWPVEYAWDGEYGSGSTALAYDCD
jgi:YD repeat-containing protein